MPGKTRSISELAAEYKVHRNTMRKWIEPIKDKLNKEKGRRLYMPWQVEMIREFLKKTHASL